MHIDKLKNLDVWVTYGFELVRLTKKTSVAFPSNKNLGFNQPPFFVPEWFAIGATLYS